MHVLKLNRPLVLIIFGQIYIRENWEQLVLQETRLYLYISIRQNSSYTCEWKDNSSLFSVTPAITADTCVISRRFVAFALDHSSTMESFTWLKTSGTMKDGIYWIYICHLEDYQPLESRHISV